jgi:hypothetical protein
MDSVGTITNMSALGAIVGAGIALAKGREEDASYILRGTVAGGVAGLLRVLIEALWF